MDSQVGVEIQGDDPTVLCKTGSLWGLGVAASLIASLAYTGGFLLQKKAHIQEERKPEHARAKSCAGLVCSTRWLIGLLCVVLVSVPFDFVAFTEAGEALAAPLKGFAIVMNQAVAPWMLGETLQFWDYISTVLVVIGCTITTIFGPHNCGPDYGVKDLFGLMKAPPFIVAESILGFLALLTMLVVWRRQFRVDYAWVNAIGEKFECPFLAFFAGAMGVQVNILMKCVGSMVADDIAGHKDQTNPNYTQYFFWVSAGLGLFFVLFQLSIINQGLAVFEAVKFMPMMVVIFILGCSVVGGVYYQEFNGFEITDWVMFPLGCMIILAGVLLLTLTEDKAKRLLSMEFEYDHGGKAIYSANVSDIGSDAGSLGGQRKRKFTALESVWNVCECCSKDCKSEKRGLLQRAAHGSEWPGAPHGDFGYGASLTVEAGPHKQMFSA